MATVYINDQPVIAKSQMTGGENFAATNKDNRYLLVQFNKPPTQADLEKLDKLEFGLLERIGGNNYVYRYKKEDLNPIRSQTFVTYANVFPKYQRIDAELRAVLNDKTQDQSKTVNVDITMQPDPEMDVPSMITKVSDALKSSKDSIVPQNVRELRTTARYNQLETLASLDGVRALCRVQEHVSENMMARITLGCPDRGDQEFVNPPAWEAKDGKGQTIIVIDHGLDARHVAFARKDPPPKVQMFHPEGIPADLNGHGTHCAASALGNGPYNVEDWAGRPQVQANRGSAPGADLYFLATNKGRDNFRFGGFDEKLVFAHSLSQSKGKIISYSWGVDKTENQPAYRDVVDNLPLDVIFLKSAGNEGDDEMMATGKWKRVDRQIGEVSACKNGITVGACGSKNSRVSDDHIPPFSSRGPLLKAAEDDEEGRIKPDVVAPGYKVLSARSSDLDEQALAKDQLQNERTEFYNADGNWMYKSGTSMATPLVAGCCAVIRAVLLEKKQTAPGIDIGGDSPPATLIKAILVNGTVDLEGGRYYRLELLEPDPSASGSSSQGDKPKCKSVTEKIGKAPNGVQGFGRVNLGASLTILNDGNYRLLTLDVRDNAEARLVLPLNVAREDTRRRTLKVTMCYSDIATPKGALQHLIALQVNIESPLGPEMAYGNRVPGTEKAHTADRINNVQKVVWPNLAPDTRATVCAQILPGTVGKFGKLFGSFNAPTKQVAIAWSFEYPVSKLAQQVNVGDMS